MFLTKCYSAMHARALPSLKQGSCRAACVNGENIINPCGGLLSDSMQGFNESIGVDAYVYFQNRGGLYVSQEGPFMDYTGIIFRNSQAGALCVRGIPKSPTASPQDCTLQHPKP